MNVGRREELLHHNTYTAFLSARPLRVFQGASNMKDGLRNSSENVPVLDLFFFSLTKWNFSQTDDISAADGSFPTVLTCVGHHQPPPGTSKHRRSVLHLSAGSERGLGSEEGFASSAERGPHRSVIRSQAPRKCLGVGRDAILCPFCSP